MLENGGGGTMLPLEKLPPPSTLLPPVPGVKDFLDENKDRADMDPDGNPYDDLRHYAYEGDGEFIFLNILYCMLPVYPVFVLVPASIRKISFFTAIKTRAYSAFLVSFATIRIICSNPGLWIRIQ
jgi:hypothetical protein